MDDSIRASLDFAAGAAKRKSRQFAILSAGARARLLRTLIPRITDAAEGWVREACRAKCIPFDSPVAGEEWLGGPVVTVRNARLLAETLEAIDRDGLPSFGREVTERDDGRIDVEVFPTSRTDAASAAGFRCVVRYPSGMSVADARGMQAAHYRKPASAHRSGTCLVLGAGNVSSIPAMDVLAKSFIEGRACVLKMNPVNEWLGPVLMSALSPLVEHGFLRIVYGGAEEGAYLCGHDAIDAIHVTGSGVTHDAIVWGPPGADRDARKRDGRQFTDKEVTSELGNVSPVLIVPADYTDKELWTIAWNVASMKANNASCNCNAAQVVVTASGWRQREVFLAILCDVLGRIPTRHAYYPGAAERLERLVCGRDAHAAGRPSAGELPWTIVCGLDPDDHDEHLFTEEAFCPVLAETALRATDPDDFLDRATTFCNARLRGTLNACIVAHPSTERDKDLAAAIDRAVNALRYGTVAINHWPGLGYGLVSPPWGAAPGATLANPESGIGWVHNTYMLDGMEKVVLKGPLVPSPKPPWFADNRATHEIGPRLVKFEASPSWLKLPGLAAAAMKG